MRRLLALLGFLAVVALALTLLYQVYLHHAAADPYVEEEPAMVRAGENFSPHLS